MVTFLITSFVIVSILVVVAYFWQNPKNHTDSYRLPIHHEPRGLFSSEDSANLQPSSGKSYDKREKTEIIQRAIAGEMKALQDAHARDDQQLYIEVLNQLTTAADSEAKLLSLVSYVTRAELPVSKQLAERMFESWKKSPDRSGTAKTLHIIALSDDAALYNTAIEATMQFRREGRLNVSAQELSTLLDGEFWLLSPKVRGSGAGFLLKRSLAGARRELNAPAPVNK